MRRTVALTGLCIFASLIWAQRPRDTSVEQWNHELRSTPSGARLRNALRQRAAAWKRLAAIDPARAAASTLPGELRDTLRNEPTAAPFLETEGEWSGTFERWVVDDFETGRHREIYGLRTESGLLSLYFAGAAPEAACSQRIQVRAMRLDNVLAVTATTQERQVSACLTTGEQKIAVLMVNLSDASLPGNITPTAVRNLYFGSGATLDAYWREASYSRTYASGDVFGPFQLGITYQCDGNDVLGSSNPVLQAAIAAADSQVDFSQYSHIAVIVPDHKFCPGVTGFATLGCTDLLSPSGGPFRASRTFIRGGGLQIASITHEAGHTLGLNHSGALYYPGSQPLGSPGSTAPLEEYGNPFDTMGGNNCGGVLYTGHYAAQHKVNTGWLLPSNVAHVQSGGTISVAALETASSGVQALRVRRGVGNEQWLWIEYRRPIGFDATLQGCSPNPFNGVLVYLEDPALPQDGRSRLLDFGASLNLPNGNRKALAASLNAGQSWVDPFTELRLEVLSAGGAEASVRIAYDQPCATLSPSSAAHSSGAQPGSVAVLAAGNCSGTAVSNAPWITVTGGASFAGNSTVTYSLPANNTPQTRTGSISIGRRTFRITQATDNGQPAPSSATPLNGSSPAGSTQRFRFVYTDPNGAAQMSEVGAVIGSSALSAGACHLSYRASDSSLRLTADDGVSIFGWPIGSNRMLEQSSQCHLNVATSSVSVSGTTLELVVDVIFQSAFQGSRNVYLYAKDTPGADSGRIYYGGWTITAPAATTAGMRFVPVTPCRAMDTRTGSGLSGAYGPPSLFATSTRTLPLAGVCGIPASARAFALNVTVVPLQPLSFLTLWPSGTSRPLVSTLNSFEGRVVANSAIVPAGPGGAIDLYATDSTDVIVDINGYFTDQATASNLVFYPVAPCRVIDTRPGQGTTGAFGPPSFNAGTTRNFPLPQGRCAIPSTAQAYSLNFTIVPPAPLSFLTVWPTGQTRPAVSTLNSFEGRIVANGAIVPAGSGGGIDIFTTHSTDVVADINGYFAPDDGFSGLYFRTLAPCRAADTRAGQGTSGAYGPPALAAGATRNLPLAGVCGAPANARAYSTNITVLPSAGALQFLTAWAGGAAQPFVSTLNSFDGRIVANAALVPAGTGGAINVFVTDRTDVVVDLSGYFNR